MTLKEELDKEIRRRFRWLNRCCKEDDVKWEGCNFCKIIQSLKHQDGPCIYCPANNYKTERTCTSNGLEKTRQDIDENKEKAKLHKKNFQLLVTDWRKRVKDGRISL